MNIAFEPRGPGGASSPRRVYSVAASKTSRSGDGPGSPCDPVEEGPEAEAARRVQRSDVGDPAGEVGAEVVVPGAVLGVRAVPDAVVEGGLERVIRLPGDVRAGV